MGIFQSVTSLIVIRSTLPVQKPFVPGEQEDPCFRSPTSSHGAPMESPVPLSSGEESPCAAHRLS